MAKQVRDFELSDNTYYYIIMSCLALVNKLNTLPEFAHVNCRFYYQSERQHLQNKSVAVELHVPVYCLMYTTAFMI